MVHRIKGPLFGPDIEPELTAETHARRTDPDTSKDAAEMALAGAPGTCRDIYCYLIREGPKTDHEGEWGLRGGVRFHSYHQRRSDLLKLDLVEDSGKRRPSPQGAAMIVWRAKI